MDCPKCGYVLSPFDEECPRCKRMGAAAPTPTEQDAEQATEAAPGAPQPMPAVLPAVAAKGQPQVQPVLPVSAMGQRRSDVLVWAAIGVGLAIVLLLGGLVWVLMHKQAPSQTVVQVPGAASPPAQSASPMLSAASPQGTPPATTGAPGLGQGQLANTEAAKVPDLGLQTGEEDDTPGPEPATWRAAYQFRGTGNLTLPEIRVRKPWRVRCYTGEAQEQDFTLGAGFMIIRGTLGTTLIPHEIGHAGEPGLSTVWNGGRGGTFSLNVYSEYKNWIVIVDQGE